MEEESYMASPFGTDENGSGESLDSAQDGVYVVSAGSRRRFLSQEEESDDCPGTPPVLRSLSRDRLSIGELVSFWRQRADDSSAHVHDSDGRADDSDSSTATASPGTPRRKKPMRLRDSLARKLLPDMMRYDSLEEIPNENDPLLEGDQFSNSFPRRTLRKHKQMDLRLRIDHPSRQSSDDPTNDSNQEDLDVPCRLTPLGLSPRLSDRRSSLYHREGPVLLRTGTPCPSVGRSTPGRASFELSNARERVNIRPRSKSLARNFAWTEPNDS